MGGGGGGGEEEERRWICTAQDPAMILVSGQAVFDQFGLLRFPTPDALIILPDPAFIDFPTGSSRHAGNGF